MSIPLKRSDENKRKYWGGAGLIGALVGLVAMKFWKSDLCVPVGIVFGLLGAFVFAAIRGSDEL